MQRVPKRLLKRWLEKEGRPIRPPSYAVIPEIYRLIKKYGPERFPFAAVVHSLADVKNRIVIDNITHVVLESVWLTTSSRYLETLVPSLMQTRLVVVVNAAPGVVDTLRGRLLGTVVVTETSSRRMLPSVRRLHKRVVDHQRTTSEADLCVELDPETEETESTEDHRPFYPYCLTSGCNTCTPSFSYLSEHRICGVCGHAASPELPSCMLCSCSLCETCTQDDPQRRNCSCVSTPDLMLKDLSGCTIAGQFVLDRLLVRCDRGTSCVYAAHLPDQIPMCPADSWPRSDAPALAPMTADRVNVVLMRVHVLASLLALMRSPGMMPPVRTGCTGGMAFAVYAFGGTRVSTVGTGDLQLAVMLKTLSTLSTVCGGLQACGQMLTVSLDDFVYEILEDGRVSVRLLLPGSAPQLLRSVLSHSSKTRLRDLTCLLIDQIARLAGPTLREQARSNMRDLIQYTAFVAGSFPQSLGGGHFDVARLDPISSGPALFLQQSHVRCWLTLIINHISDVLNTPLNRSDGLAAGAWAESFRAT